MQQKIWLLMFMIITATGCASNHQILKPKTFETFEDFRLGPKDGVDLVWAKRGIFNQRSLERKIAQYDSILYDQVYIVLDKEKSDHLSDDEIIVIKDHFINQLKALNTTLKVVEKPQQKTLRVTVAITNVQTPNPILAITSSVLPVGLGISTISKVLTGEHTNVGSASMEILVSDATTGEPIIAAIDRRAGNKDLRTMIDSSDDIKDAINWWVKQLSLTLAQYKS
ncbi:hypothetical protein AYY19_18320 [Photobacterium aquimaris]|uniref:DUF3313 domain-containing protein n=1 Tax=Photobacterium aquimaris TaxID=512643 RepID=UPI0007EF76B0|nr:DUF3313 domain-containing protein [Photobacterium aquimaris]OBU14977.1 hypothetical protein AYY19_18320 [Photobacterium aquimaris]PSW00077.1 DUF3313 domain-containing protein [Photobacterium aquimaris]